jgi:hypothetical protein
VFTGRIAADAIAGAGKLSASEAAPHPTSARVA